MEEAMPLKSFFGSFQYLDSLPSYKDSTFSTNARYWNGFVTYILSWKRVLRFSKNRSDARLEFGLG